jgi:leucyl aminopeptidase
MKITLSTSAPSQIETECRVVAVIDTAEKSENGAKDKPAPQLLTNDQAVTAAAADLVASGEVTGKSLESALLHKPAGLKAKRLLLVGGGKAKNFAASDLRKIARQCYETNTMNTCSGYALKGNALAFDQGFFHATFAAHP